MNKTVPNKNPVIGLNLQLTSARKKRSSTTKGRGSSVKRLCTDNIPLPIINEGSSGAFQSQSSITNELNNSISQIRKQIFGLSQTVDQQRKTMNEILNNQKKMTKAMRNNNVITKVQFLLYINLFLDSGYVGR